MAKIIPITPNVNAFSERLALDDEYFILTFRWNDRAERWYLDIADAASAPIVSGLVVCADTAMTGHLTGYDRMPQGILVAVDGTGSGTDPGHDELGQRVKVIYLEAADLV